MSSLNLLDKQYLAELCCEMETYIKDEHVIILAEHRETFISELANVKAQLQMQPEISRDLLTFLKQAIASLCERIARKVNVERYFNLGNCIDAIKQLINKIQQNTLSSAPETTPLFTLLKKQYPEIAISALDKGNAATIVNAYKNGYLNLEEASDAIGAIFNCSNNLTLNQVTTLAQPA
ncbi:hypothetical protein [Thaumasiovibrio subtropicus]|uniref:hypothetical protein n=1 Tax=Thaumasiovibrio subtropicus TaxID=1891207 RepID=UPI000B357326|nr:hypothetical protein [Thaumasiovibrio subtropicus]